MANQPLDKLIESRAADLTQPNFILSYIHGGNAAIRRKNFFHSGDKKSAIQRGKDHCNTMGYKFIRVDPFFANLDEDEKLIQDPGPVEYHPTPAH